MYLQHFQLTEAPFTLTPDTGFFFAHGGHQEALNVLLVALREGEGFIKITGEVGTGKTLLCRQLLRLLDDGVETAYLPNPFINPNGLRAALAAELGIQCPRNSGQHRLLQLIYEKLLQLQGAGRPVVLLLDEAQSIPDDTLEALRLLSNLETEKRKLLQVVLFGQPELDRRLDSSAFRQLKQRIAFSYRLKALDAAALNDYVRHRLTVAGNPSETLFDKRAVRLLHRASGGIPRLVNLLCHKALLAAYGCGEQRITRRHVQAAVHDTDAARTRRSTWLSLSAGIGGALAATRSHLFEVRNP